MSRKMLTKYNSTNLIKIKMGYLILYNNSNKMFLLINMLFRTHKFEFESKDRF